MITLLLFLAALAILIVSHEFGHFLFAKLSGAKVEEFGLGFPPKIFSFKKGETVYSINLIPFGGFVKILGEDSTDGSVSRSFSSRPLYARTAIIAGGVFFNLILAWILLSAIFFIGAPTSVGEDASNAHVTILEVQKGTPAENAGLLPGDTLQELSFEKETLTIQTVEEVQNFIQKYKGQEITIKYLRGKELFTITALPDPSPPKGVGSLGIAMDKVGIVSLPFHKAIWEGLKTTGLLIVAVVKALYGLFNDIFRGVPGAADTIAGPVGIYMIFGNVSQAGFIHVLFLMVNLSVVLAIINFIPFPALDGGRLLFLAIEAIKRSPINQKVVQWTNAIGFFLIIALMLLVTYKDILRLIG